MPVTDLTGRTLPHQTAEEWLASLKQLVGTPLDGLPLDPQRTLVVVVEDEDVVVAHAIILSTVHVEELHIAETHRGHAGTARALVTAITEELARQDVWEVLALSRSEETDALYAHAGGKRLNGKLYVIPVRPGEGSAT